MKVTYNNNNNNNEFIKHPLSRQPISEALRYKNKSAMKNKYEIITKSSSEQEPNGIPFGLNEF